MNKSINEFYMSKGATYDKLVAATSISHYQKKKLSCRRYEYALVQPCQWDGIRNQLCGGVIDKCDNFVNNSGFHEFFQTKAPYTDERVIRRHETSIYIGCFIQVWGHIFTDCLAKLWYLQTQECQEYLQKGAKLIYLTTDNQPLNNYFVELFEIAGFNINKCEHIKNFSRFDYILIPDNSFFIQKESGYRFYTDEFSNLIDSIYKKYSLQSGNYPTKVYFTRTRYKSGKRDYGEKKIEKCFKNAGFTIISPELLPVKDQIALVAHCDVYASTEGSISHNCIFCKPEATVIILKKGKYVNGYQTAINDVRSLHVKYVDIGRSIYNRKDEPWQGPFFLHPNKYLYTVLGLPYKKNYLFFNHDWFQYIFRYNQFSIWLRKHSKSPKQLLSRLQRKFRSYANSRESDV